MRRLLLLPILAVALAASGTITADDDAYVRLTAPDRAALDHLTRLVSIDRVERDQVFAYASGAQMERLEALGIPFVVLPAPGLGEEVRTGLAARAKAGQWDAYPTWGEYVALMEGFATARPDLCRLVDLGPTANQVRPHRLLALRISDHPDLEEDEPAVLLTSSVHGDEVVGYVLLLRLVDELLTHHDPSSSDPYDQRITRLVDSLELWVNPLANPDGTYAAGDHTLNGARRFLANPDGTSSGVDMNRNFPDPVLGDHPDGNPWWPETVAFTALAAQERFALSANLHGGAEVVNYPWDSRPDLHPDDAWFRTLARAYADQVHSDAADPGYLRDLDDGITNGWAWYSVYGGRQDFTTFFHGGRETTIELSHVKKPDPSTLPGFWQANRQALLGYLEAALEGVRGVVTDPDRAPLAATVSVLLHDRAEDRSSVAADPAVGDYHRLIDPGRYLLVFECSGHMTEAVQALAPPGPATRVDVTLEPERGLSATLAGTVRLEGGGAAVAGATVELLYPGGEPAVVTAADGRFAFSSLPEGARVVRVSAPGRGTRVVTSRALAPHLELDVEVPRSVSVPRPAEVR
jgi:hypothetical protein